ncbi:MAG: hypothetical protein PHI90_09805 [Clostridia bacterium]|nr:hypothetical protein [Clostridia bacterium]MDD4049084.1 hypothetical protein [Clostridia bacterium]
MIASFILLVPIVVIIFIIFGVIGVKGESKEGGEEVIKKVYIYLVLFATLMMTIGGSVTVFMSIADIVSPTPYYQTFEDYRLNQDKSFIDKNEMEEVQLTEEELKERYTAKVNFEKERDISRAKNTLIKSFGWIVIPLPIFLYFQRSLAKKEE